MTSTLSLKTRGGLALERSTRALAYPFDLAAFAERLDTHRGAIFASGHEAPGRYARWDLAFIDPPLELTARGLAFTLRALNARGRVMLPAFDQALREAPEAFTLEADADEIRGTMAPPPERIREEERLRRPTALTVVRALLRFLAADDPHLGFYGAFGYELAFRFEPIRPLRERDGRERDVHLYLPDALVVADHHRQTVQEFRYEFHVDGGTTADLPRDGEPIPYRPGTESPLRSDFTPAEYEAAVERVREGCRKGDYFEVVPSRRFSAGYAGTPHELFLELHRANPSPYEFLLHLGDQHLVGASPEMFVKVEGRRVETCPISGTAARGRDAMEDAERIRELLDSAKEEAELTMCTDVDRNDKARVCKPGSIEIIGRRMVETYSRLFHTVDHVIGTLRDDCDALDAFAAHLWACTLTGAPKPAAMQEIEAIERSPREWYGGAVGVLRADGTVNTGITIRTLQLRDGEAHLRVGATLLYHSEPEAEERETRIKASAFLDALLQRKAEPEGRGFEMTVMPAPRVLFVDHEDSFVHNLASYVRETGAQVVTYRSGFDPSLLDEEKPDLVFLSPGPGSPEQRGVPDLVRACAERGLPVFGVCLGLQGMVQAFGGELGVLPVPHHGVPSDIENNGEGIFEGFPAEFRAGRYHSLYAVEGRLPADLEITARSEDGVIMAVRHRTLPMAAVQFHPESLLTLGDQLGRRLIRNVVASVAKLRMGS